MPPATSIAFPLDIVPFVACLLGVIVEVGEVFCGRFGF